MSFVIERQKFTWTQFYIGGGILSSQYYYHDSIDLSIEIDILQWSNKIIGSCGFVWVGIFEFWMERKVYLSNSEYF